MTEHYPPLGDSNRNAQAFLDAMVVACNEISKAIEAKGEMPTINDMISGMIAAAAFYIAGIDDAHARKALLREMEKGLPRAVAYQRSKEGGGGMRGKVVTIYQGGKTN